MININSPIAALVLGLSLFPASANGSNLCPPFKPEALAGFTKGDALEYADLPDADTVRATSTLETVLINKHINQGAGPIVKHWCQIGVQRMIVDFEVPVEDDSVSFEITRGVYVWDTSFDVAGWRIDQIGTRFRCARGDNPFAKNCP